MKTAPKAQGLYDPQYEHDACGIGAVVDISGTKSHKIVAYGKQVLLNLQHRGAAGADESTGDGAGILMQIPHEFFAAEADRLKFDLPAAGHYGVGILFLPRDRAIRGTCEEVLAQNDRSRGPDGAWAGATCLATTARWARSPAAPSRSSARSSSAATAWRTRNWSGGCTAAASGPSGGRASIWASRPTLSTSRRCRAGRSATRACSWPRSCSPIIPTWPIRDMTTALAVVHQRYSTNTFPSWRLAQPFRMIAHNGEINTLRGNLQPPAGLREDDGLPGLGRGPVGPVSRSSSRAAAIRPVSTTAWSCWSARAARRRTP